MSEDRRLIKALQRGESAAWRRIYLKYKDDMLTVARSLVTDVNTAEDCLQVTVYFPDALLAESNRSQTVL